MTVLRQNCISILKSSNPWELSTTINENRKMRGFLYPQWPLFAMVVAYLISFWVDIFSYNMPFAYPRHKSSSKFTCIAIFPVLLCLKSLLDAIYSSNRIRQIKLVLRIMILLFFYHISNGNIDYLTFSSTYPALVIFIVQMFVSNINSSTTSAVILCKLFF